MLNSIAILYVRWMVGSQDPVILRDMAASVPRTALLPAVARLPKLVSSEPPLHWGFLIMVGLCFVVWFVLQRTTTGFEIRMVGANPNAARYAGISVNRVIVLVMAVSGACAGLAGAGEITGTTGYLSPGTFVNIGFDSIAIALLARANPFAVIPAAILWGSMLSGAPLMQQETGLSIDVIRIVQALVLLFVAADVIVRTIFRIKGGGQDALEEAAAGDELGRDRMSTSTVPTQRSARDRIPRFGRLQTIGLLYGLLGILLTAYVAPNIEPADKAFTFEVPPNPATFTFDPRTMVLAFGLFFVLTAVVSTARPARTNGGRAACCSSRRSCSRR